MKSVDELGTWAGELICVRCGGGLAQRRAELECRRCAHEYPVVGGIPVLLHRPAAALAFGRLSLAADQAQARAVERQSEAALRQRASSGLQQRIERWRRGTLANLELLQAHVDRSVLERSAAQDVDLGLLDWVACQASGWSVNRLLPYFHQDWCGTPQFEDVRSLVVGARRRHAAGAGAVAVLGAGACGLVHALAADAGPVYGVDLCLPALLLARALASGEALHVALEDAEWRSVRVPPPAPAAHPIGLIQANVNALPFADGALSVVVTQYLLDLMGKPLWLCAELQRVLRPGGIWINFSNPFPMPGEPVELERPRLDEVRELLASEGFDLIEAERREFALNDATSVLASAIAQTEEVHFFVARRRPEPSRLPEGRRWMQDELWWQQRVALVPGREVDILRHERAGGGEPSEGVSLRLPGATFPVPEALATTVAHLFGQLAERPRLADLAANVERAGWPLSRNEFRELMHYLIEHHGLVELGATEPPA